MSLALQKTEKVKSTFIHIQLLYEKHKDIPSLIQHLENTEAEFRSVAFESASMAIAATDFETGRFPDAWNLFANDSSVHKAQVYIGLGWAVAKLKIPFLQVVKNMETQQHYRIAEGCGYFDGCFRFRQTVTNGQAPDYLPDDLIGAYDQGLGRSLWYNAKADIEKVAALINGFPAGRHADLWRGIGLAVAYVGGCEDEELKILLQHAATNKLQLFCGAALAVKSRMEADTMTADTDRCSRLWYTLTTVKLNPDDEAVYLNRINQTM